ncbi:MAG: glycosyltransferase family 4 protein [Deltaproteobacteria bacterium]|nr:glycosyltransferase family 4 protein [Deltaproteobacteria bacterium]MBW1833888.1 glycosyltransferase family 4 protein [Deltaproteobacteria bacterium]MBW2165860.1 glycosyltransferase family 4 protein [Deltaproteobacteria bacterium]
MKILLLSRYSRLGASSRLRSYQYLPYLKAQGIDVTVASLLGDEYIKNLYTGRRVNLLSVIGAYVRRITCLLKSNRFDLLWIEYEILPWLPAWAERILACFGIPYIVDYDDAIFHRYDMHQWRMVRRILGDKIDKVIHQATLVIAGNRYLADRARRAGARWIECLPTVVDLKRYRVDPNRKKSVVNFGWIGSPTTAKYLYLVTHAFAKVCSDINARLVLVGSGQVQLDGIPTEIRTWSEETEVKNIQDFDVGIMPIPDDPWTRGKCGYKLIQYMACGRPVIASPVGVNQQIVEDGANGFLAITVSDWVHALKTLGNDYELRDRMGKAARAKVESQYSLQVAAPRLADLMRNMVSEFE